MIEILGQPGRWLGQHIAGQPWRSSIQWLWAKSFSATKSSFAESENSRIFAATSREKSNEIIGHSGHLQYRLRRLIRKKKVSEKIHFLLSFDESVTLFLWFKKADVSSPFILNKSLLPSLAGRITDLSLVITNWCLYIGKKDRHLGFMCPNRSQSSNNFLPVLIVSTYRTILSQRRIRPAHAIMCNYWFMHGWPNFCDQIVNHELPCIHDSAYFEWLH